MIRGEGASLSREEGADSESCLQSSGADGLPDGAAKDAGSGRCRLRVTGPLVAAAAVASCLMAAASTGHLDGYFEGVGPAVEGAGAAIGGALSLQSAGTLLAAGKGCSNYKVSAIGKPTVVGNADDCGSLCSAQAGCVQYNYQEMDKSQCPMGGMVKGECYLFSDECSQEDNTCWNLYKISAPTPLSWYLKARRTLCTDWKTNSIGGTYTLEFNANTCGLRCSQTTGCKFFNFQPGPCTGQIDSIEQGACLLYSDACTTQEDVCTDLYGMRGGEATTSSQPTSGTTSTAGGTMSDTTPGSTTTFDGTATLKGEATAGDFELFLREQPIQFQVGNVVQIGTGMAFESGEIAAIDQGTGTITLVKSLKFDYPLGTTVQFIQAVFDTKVTAIAAKGTRVVSIADSANYRPDDAVSIGDPPVGPYMANRIQSVDRNTSTVTLEFSLPDDVAKGTTFKKISSTVASSP